MKGITTIIVIIIIVVVGFFMLQDDTATIDNDTVTNELSADGAGDNVADMIVENEDNQIDTTAEIIVVTYLDEGFSPKDIDVSSGQTVRFVNESGGNMWVASDIHPTHKILPEFDNKKSIGNGESYEFTFTKAGKWDYHNHIKPNVVGTITVK